MSDRQRQIIGIGATAVGVVIVLAGSFFAHFTELPEFDDVGIELYPFIPRGWGWVLLGQTTAVIGSQIALLGVAVGFLWKREVTWARASIGAFLLTAEMIILYGIVPNQWLTLTQATLEWTPQKIAFTLPTWLTLNNEVSVSYAAIKDIVSGTYAVVLLGAIAFGLIKWQDRQKKLAEQADVTPVSLYGRPLRKVGAEENGS